MAAEPEIVDGVEGEEEEEKELDLSTPEVVTKYRLAADIANATLDGVVGRCVAGADVLDLCKFGDALIEAQCTKAYKKKIDKGVAFPTSISVNNCVCHFSPLDGESVALKAGDVVKVDLGCQIDGFIAVVATTAVVPEGGAAAGGGGGGGGAGAAEAAAAAGPVADVTGKLADVLAAAHTAAQVAVRLIKPGNKNAQVTEAIAEVAKAFDVRCVQGVLSHQMKQYVIDGNKVIIQREEAEQKVDEAEFETFETYAIDICMSSGEGKPRELGTRTTIFKRAVDQSYMCKMKASRTLLNEVSRRFPTLPFTLRALEDEKTARMGVVECIKHGLVHAYPVLYEKDGDFVAHVKLTVLLLPTGTLQVTGKAALPAYVKSDKVVPPAIAEILATSAHASKKKKKKKAAKKDGEAEEEDA